MTRTELKTKYIDLFRGFAQSVGFGYDWGTGIFEVFVGKFDLPYGHKDFDKLFDYYDKVVAHKKAVFKNGELLLDAFGQSKHHTMTQLLYHDLSKFSAQESAYADVNFKDFKSNSDEIKQAFKLAWHHHKTNNPHHPEYWFNVGKSGSTTPLNIPRNYLAEMVADWMGASETYGTPIEEWMQKSLSEFTFHPQTGLNLTNILEEHLGIYTSYVFIGDGTSKLRFSDSDYLVGERKGEKKS